MPRGDKSSYTDKQKRQASHIEEGYESAAFPKKKQGGALGPQRTKYPGAAENQAQAFKEIVILWV